MRRPTPAEPATGRRSRTPRTDRFEAAAFHGDCPRCAYPWPLPLKGMRAPNRCSECGLTHAARRRFSNAYVTDAELMRHHSIALRVLVPMLYASLLALILTPVLVVGIVLNVSLQPAHAMLMCIPWVVFTLLGVSAAMRLFRQDRADRLLLGHEHFWARVCGIVVAVMFIAALLLIVFPQTPLLGGRGGSRMLSAFLLGVLGLIAYPILIDRRLTVLAARRGNFQLAREAERLVRTTLIMDALMVLFILTCVLIGVVPGNVMSILIAVTIALGMVVSFYTFVLCSQTVGVMVRLRRTLNTQHHLEIGPPISTAHPAHNHPNAAHLMP